MAQLRGKVNHFGKTDLSNFYKNQQITNRSDPVFCLLTKLVLVRFEPELLIAGLFSALEHCEEKKMRLYWLSFASGSGYGLSSFYFVQAEAGRISRIGH